MNIIERIIDKVTGSGPPIVDLANSLEPEGLPSHARTSEAADAYFSDLSQLYEVTPPGPDGLRATLGEQIEQVRDLAARLRLVAGMRAAAARRSQDRSVAEKQLSAAGKLVRERAAAHASAASEAASFARRLAGLRGAQESMETDEAAQQSAARERFSAAVLAGDATAEAEAASELAACMLNHGPTSPEQMALGIRVQEIAELLASKRRATEAASDALKAAERERFSAEIEIAAVAHDESTDAYALRLLELLRVAERARAEGFGDVADLRGLAATRVWVHDYRRTWFNPADNRVTSGYVEMLQQLRALVLMLDGQPFDPTPLARDMRRGSSQTKSTLAAAA